MPSKHTLYYNLLDALAKPGCACCTLAIGAVNRYLEGLLYEYVNDGAVQRTWIAAHGLCPTHSEVLLNLHGSALGVAILYRVILRHLMEELQNEKEEKGALAQRLPHWFGSTTEASTLAAHEPCPACRIRDEGTTRTIEMFAYHGEDPELIAALRQSEGFCLPHLQRVKALVTGPAGRVIWQHQLDAWRNLESQLEEFIRKSDYRFRHEGLAPGEGESWRNAVQATVGSRLVF